jgi:hypothetical protein
MWNQAAHSVMTLPFWICKNFLSRISHLDACTTSMEHGPSIIGTHSTQDVTHTLGQVVVAKI